MSRESSFRNQFLYLLYYSLVLLFLLPIWLTGEFITLHGPVYLNAATQLKKTIFDTNSAFHFSIYSILSPDSFIQYCYLLLSTILSYGFAVKVMASLQVLLFLIVFRSIILSLNQRAIYRPFLIFPFVYNLPFVLGLLNFSWGVVWWMISLLFLIKLSIYPNFKKNAWMYWFSLSMLCYLSSISAYFLMLIMAFFWIAFQKDTLLRKHLFQHWIPAIIPLCVFTLQFFSNPNVIIRYSTTFTERLYSWISCESIVTFQELERLSTWPVGILISGLLLFSIVKVLRSQNAEPERLHWQRILTFTSFISAIAYFFFPDQVNTDDILLIKIQVIGILGLLMVMATIRLKKVYMIPLGFLFVGMSVVRLRQQVQNWEELGVAASEYLEVVGHVPDNSIVESLNYSTNTYHHNFESLWQTNQNIFLKSDTSISGEAAYVFTWEMDKKRPISGGLMQQGTLVFSSKNNRGKLYQIKKPELEH